MIFVHTLKGTMTMGYCSVMWLLLMVAIETRIWMSVVLCVDILIRSLRLNVATTIPIGMILMLVLLSRIPTGNVGVGEVRTMRWILWVLLVRVTTYTSLVRWILVVILIARMNISQLTVVMMGVVQCILVRVGSVCRKLLPRHRLILLLIREYVSVGCCLLLVRAHVKLLLLMMMMMMLLLLCDAISRPVLIPAWFALGALITLLQLHPWTMSSYEVCMYRSLRCRVLV